MERDAANRQEGILCEIPYGPHPRSLVVWSGLSLGAAIVLSVLAGFLGGFWLWWFAGAMVFLAGFIFWCAKSSHQEGAPHRIVLREDGLEVPIFDPETSSWPTRRIRWSEIVDWERDDGFLLYLKSGDRIPISASALRARDFRRLYREIWGHVEKNKLRGGL